MRLGGGVWVKGHRLAPTSHIIVLLGGLLTLFFLVLVVYPPSPVKAFEYVGYDEMVRFLGGEPPPPDVAVIDIDEPSLAKLGQWPWPRYRIAALVEQASALGARSIAMDFLFAEPDRLSLAEVGDLYRRDRGIELNLSGVPGDALDNDRVLAETVARHAVVLGADLRFDETMPDRGQVCGNPLSVVLRALPETEGTPPVPLASGMVCPVPELAEAATFVAATNSLPDRDGKLRRAPLVLRCGEKWVPSLAAGALLAASGENQVVLKWSNAGVLELRIGETVIPTDGQGNLLFPFRMRPPDRFLHISAADLLEGRVEPERLKDKIVFVGSSASGLQDMHATPVMRLCPGVDLHALAADAILRKDFFVQPGWSRGGQAVLVVLAGVLVTVLAAWTRVVVSALMTAGAIVMLTLSCWAIFDQWGAYWSPLPGVSMLAAGASLLTFVRLRHEEKRKQLLRQSFARYVSAEIVDQIVRSSQPVNVSGERRTVTILLTDIRGFTSMSETMAPEELVQFLNSYFAAMIDIILENEGTLDKFMGDAVLALFGAPVQHDDDALRAVKVALAMQETLGGLNAQWQERGKPRIRVGIGISTGEVIIGNIGSARRLEYTAIGRDVNYAQRIEALTKELPFDILVNETTYEQVKDYVDAEKFGPLAIRGKEAPVCIYGIRGLSSSSH
ncbi:MAG TPA: adenylate/guanylate cyclase domain-containing protein [Candidatus Hydrogenedentes bacterium]|nr:adenylate/guanylate cyclase domain-containing protein [Candidatus Hydrogenedentota bacterium]HQE81492.1 adenylate/guanylate cyclase domain-containing protein [Candidatus Hydrogenedentota bacterium]HQH54473.1 adenylate/guanylate cyclase domain-containing protein [Candidatus Hydrogenedentota bacterium]HQM49409.1 adenylate/guanylate cyclase domain-containing protein [Candidatus Hydrogenedentota bacterium]